jgi:alanine dehydrogenase
MTLILTNGEVMSSLDMAHLMAKLEDALRVEARDGVRSVPRINLDGDEGRFFRVMPVVVPELDIMGLKAFNRSSSNGVRYLIGLWSVQAGELLALIDASYLTAARTGAITGIATRAITAGNGAVGVGVIGSGLEARTNLEAICVGQAVSSVKAFSPNRERREHFAREMTEQLAVDVQSVDSAAEAADSEVVLVATNTGNGTGRVALQNAWLRPRTHVSTIGSTMPSLREVDAQTFGRADFVVVDTVHAVSESGDLLDAVAHGCWDDGKVMELADLIAAGVPPRNGDAGLTVFKSVGTSLQDVVAAHAVYETALERGIGESIAFLTEKAF